MLTIINWLRAELIYKRPQRLERSPGETPND